MKNKFMNIFIISFIILGSLFVTNHNSYAQNTENEALKEKISDNEISRNEISNSGTSSQNEIKKSSNANLNNLGIRPYDFTGFRYGKTTYDVLVPETTKTVQVYAEAQDSKAKVSGTGNKTLEEIKTSVDVVVTAEDGTKKTYTINITKGNEDYNKEEDSNTEEESDGLSNLKISELKLNPDFKTNTYEYSVKYIGENTSLDIKAEPTNEDYIVEVVGNENLKEGANIITILVSEKNGNNVATYQITVNKSLIDEEAVAREKAKKQKDIIMLGTIGIIVVLIIIFIIVKQKRNKKYDEEFLENPFNELNEEEKDERHEEEIPKALNKKHEDEKEYEEMTKEDARKKFLDNYNSDYEEERKIRKKNKGKRFK